MGHAVLPSAVPDDRKAEAPATCRGVKRGGQDQWGQLRKLEDTGHSARVASVPEGNPVTLRAADSKGTAY